MKLLLIFLGMTVSMFAEAPWPKSELTPKFVETRTSRLPKILQNALLKGGEFTLGGNKLPDTLEVCRIDLQGDGSEDYIVQSDQSYSGGPQMDIFTQRHGRFVHIGGAQGGIYFAARVNGYREIISTSRGGGGRFTRCLMRYQGDRYHLVRLTDYQMRETGGILDFVQERDPKGNDY